MRFLTTIHLIFLLSSSTHVAQAMQNEKEFIESYEQLQKHFQEIREYQLSMESAEKLRESTNQLRMHLEEIRTNQHLARDSVRLYLQLGSRRSGYKVCRQPIRAVPEQKGSIEKHFKEIKNQPHKRQLKTMVRSMKCNKAISFS